MLIQRKGTVKEVSETLFKRKYKDLGYEEVKEEVKGEVKEDAKKKK